MEKLKQRFSLSFGNDKIFLDNDYSYSPLIYLPSLSLDQLYDRGIQAVRYFIVSLTNWSLQSYLVFSVYIPLIVEFCKPYSVREFKSAFKVNAGCELFGGVSFDLLYQSGQTFELNKL